MMAYDKKCYELAKYFLSAAPEEDVEELAQDIQNCIEMNTTVEVTAKS